MLTCLHYITITDFFQKTGICLEVSHITSTQISISKASHKAILNFRVIEECNPTMYPEERARILVNSPNDHDTMKELGPYLAHGKHSKTGRYCYY